MPAPLFKRWVPHTPASKQSAPASASATIAPFSNHGAKASRHTPDAASIRDSETLQSPVEISKAVKKPKKRKREAALEAPDESPKRHKTILSKFEKVSRLAEASREELVSQVEEEQQPTEPLHDLQPMPQPAPVPEPAFEPTFSTLPAWLAQPLVVEASKTLPFSDLGVDAFYLKKLEKQGFREALAAQTALLPMIHSGFEQHLGDICVSAKTGSGKTLAYLLPIVEALKDRVVPVLSAIIVVPSRQLVNQALTVAEELCTGTKIRVGTALGNVAFATEQKQLVKTRSHYDPKGAKELQQRASDRVRTGSIERGGILEDLKSMPLNHIPCYDSGVDILICTPGRLVEHIENTTGFMLNNVRWLVIDEADQLLNQNFQGWANILMNALHGETPVDFMSAKERIRKREREANSIWSLGLPARRQLTKIVLSATMERDLTKLGTLKLRRPKLVVIQGETTEQSQALEHEENVYELPSTLDEFAVHVGDGSNKPLHLLYVLLNYVFPETQSSKQDDATPSDTDSDSSSEDDSDREGASMVDLTNRVLIFTKSTESASRLSHLLTILQPTFKKYLETMTRALTADASRKLLKSFSTGVTRILVASDAASRGLDIPSITHVINYDIPTSITSYVHRVGRTARAGKAGQAWTLFSKSEAAWFLKQVTKGDSIKRGSKKVKRTDWKESAVTADGRKKAYREALKQLESAVAGA